MCIVFVGPSLPRRLEGRTNFGMYLQLLFRPSERRWIFLLSPTL